MKRKIYLTFLVATFFVTFLSSGVSASTTPKRGPVYSNMKIANFCGYETNIYDRLTGSFSTSAAIDNSKTRTISQYIIETGLVYKYYYEDVNGVGYVPLDEGYYNAVWTTRVGSCRLGN